MSKFGLSRLSGHRWRSTPTALVELRRIVRTKDFDALSSGGRKDAESFLIGFSQLSICVYGPLKPFEPAGDGGTDRVHLAVMEEGVACMQ